MVKREFKTESKRLLDMMVNSIYTHKEIFLRELISNSSDAIDKIYYNNLADSSQKFNKDDYYIKIESNKDDRTLTIFDTGIGMTESELENNLGTIAQSGSLAFKKDNEMKDGYDIIGQFGVGFYSAFMVADEVTVISKALGNDKAYKWVSSGADGYTIEECDKESIGTTIVLNIKEDTEDESYSDYLEEYKLKSIVKKYSDFIRYPIKMDITEHKLKEDSEDDYEEVVTEQTVNSMVPIWRKSKSELKEEDYNNFYTEKRYGFDKPLKYIHTSVEGLISYKSILFIPEQTPYDYYSKEYEKGLELYSNGVLIMNKCHDLLPDYFSFVKGMVDSSDLSLNISRELLQHNKQLKLIAKNINNKIKKELENMLSKNRESYNKFYKSFGRQLKYGVYENFGANKDTLQSLLMFYSSTQKEMVTLDEYISRMTEDQKFIYYAVGDSVEQIAKMPKTEIIADKGYEILYLTEDVDEFALKVLREYQEKEFKSVSSGDLGLDKADNESDTEDSKKDYSDMLNKMKEILGSNVSDVRVSKRLKNHPVCLSTEGEVSIEMEKILNAMPNNEGIKANKILEINENHEIFNTLQNSFENDKEKLEIITEVLYNQALLIEGLPISDPVKFVGDMCKIIK